MSPDQLLEVLDEIGIECNESDSLYINKFDGWVSWRIRLSDGEWVLSITFEDDDDGITARSRTRYWTLTPRDEP